MLENEAKQLIENLKAMVESDGNTVPGRFAAEGIKALTCSTPPDQLCFDCKNTISGSLSAGKKAEDEKEKKVRPNSLAIFSRKTLNEYDAALSFYKMLQLELVPLAPTFDLPHLLQLHEFIFSEIYPDAGKLRKKNRKISGNEFIDVHNLSDRLNEVLIGIDKALKKHEKPPSKADAVAEISYFMGEFYLLHPFEYGNGRVSRVFFRQYADKIGYKLNYGKILPITLRAAELHVFKTGAIKPLTALINNCLTEL